MKLSGFLLVLSVSCCAARGSELGVGGEADGVNASDSSNLTQILENWRSSIMAEVKDLLLHHHHAVLPDYSRIPPMSQSLENLEQEFSEIRGDVDGLKVTFSSFGDLLGKLGSARNVSHTSELRATFEGFKDLLKKLRSGRKLPHKPGGMDRQPRRKGTIVRRRKPVTNTGLGTRTHTHKYVQRPRLRLPAGRVQRNFSPRTCDLVPFSSLCSFILLTLSFSII
ncbi:uncharacterized protein isoform X1 [Takifugu rubripes]|uniref:uncharacterized protein isoform X1 n=1 Tax=Takifugu rubripes TaxID=31033 RepID=UPI0011459CDF|nr:uncharacterized protein LOC105416874 isoform X1 [Takifugu rubripes]